MTDLSIDPDDPNMRVEATFRTSDGPEITLETIHLGLSAAIYCAFVPEVETNTLVLKVISVDLDPEEAPEMLRQVADAIDEAREKHNARGDDQ